MTQKSEKVETTEIAVKAEAAVAQKSATIGRGFENVDASTVTMPRAKLLQSNSPEVSDRDYNLRAGDIVHTLLMEKVPEKFIPISIWDSNIMFVPRADERKASMKAMLGLSDADMEAMVICRAVDGKHGDKYGECTKCGRHKFDGNEKPWCNATINVLAVPLEDDTLGLPLVLQFSNTSYKHGKKFRDTAFYSSLGEDLFSRVYKLESAQAQGNGNSWYEMKVKPAGRTLPTLLGEIEALYDSFATKIIVVEPDDDSPQGTDNY